MAEKPQKIASGRNSGESKSDTAKRPASAKATDGQGGSASDVALREEGILDFWRTNDIFNKSVQKDAPKGEYVFYDGPPFATGLPHYGHIVASVIKDVVPRYWTMRGYRVPRVWGWDCHGLPIENIVEKELGFKHKKDIVKMGVAKFNELCRERVLTYAHEWEKIIPRIGRWADMKNAYRTMDKPFMESVWWVFKELWDKGLVYEDYRSMHICPRCETTLSQQEVAEGYKDVKDISVYAKFKVKNPQIHGLPEKTYVLAWTTTPWTLPGNVALAVGKEIEYSHFTVEKSQDAKLVVGETYLLSEEARRRLFGAYAFAEGSDPTGPAAFSSVGVSGYAHVNNIKQRSGASLVGIEYEPLFDYYAKDETLKNRENGWKVYGGDFVTTEDGTGIVHIAPGFGTDDWELSKRENLPFVQHVNIDGTFKVEVTDFAGKEVKPIEDPSSADVEIIKYLAAKELLFAKQKYEHSYPHCWRCDTPLLNYATSSWFVSVTKIKDDLLKNAAPINWSPVHIKDGRFGKWLEGARDWSISRQRFWASVMPVWVCEKCKEKKVFGSAAELEKASGLSGQGKKIDDLHKHIVDDITVPCECGGVMHRVPDVLDTWFDSGSMPYGERHYPFENKAEFDKVFPAQFIAEGVDQTRAWFYYLHVLAGAIFNKNAFQNVVVNGIVLAEDGKKMSKKLQNYPDPMEVVEKYGADALRHYLLQSPVMQAENLSFSERGVAEVAMKHLSRLHNVLAFYQLYANQPRPTSGRVEAGGIVRDQRSTNVLDQWILARTAALVAETTSGYENYELDTAARPLALFIDDLSAWYLRRSRDRFKNDGADKTAALATLRYVLHTLSRVIAPAMPFMAEYLFQAAREEEDEESVHLSMWPEVPQFSFDPVEVLGYMLTARLVVTQALEARDKAGIKVRQPLAKLSIPASVNIPDEYRSIIADEINIKEIVSEGYTVKLDTKISDELRDEGELRDFVRYIQMLRKSTQFVPTDRPSLTVRTTEEGEEFIERNRDVIVKKGGLGGVKVIVAEPGKVQVAGPCCLAADEPFELEMYLEK
ncbi:MAG TPA: class I tRNA ligase family protein [Candidatus Paceibacterota bacterium]